MKECCRIQLKYKGPFVSFAGLVAAAFVLTVFLYPKPTNADNSIVFLSSMLPIEKPSETQSEVSLSEPSPVPDNSDQVLIELLRGDENEAAYSKLEDQPRWQAVRMRVTGYCSCPKCCGIHSDGITACNHRIVPGDTFVAADKFYSFGTEMIIPGYNQDRSVQVMDRGRAIKGNRLDIFFHSHAQAQKWGVKYLDVMVKVE